MVFCFFFKLFRLKIQIHRSSKANAISQFGLYDYISQQLIILNLKFSPLVRVVLHYYVDVKKLEELKLFPLVVHSLVRQRVSSAKGPRTRLVRRLPARDERTTLVIIVPRALRNTHNESVRRCSKPRVPHSLCADGYRVARSASVTRDGIITFRWNRIAYTGPSITVARCFNTYCTENTVPGNYVRDHSHQSPKVPCLWPARVNDRPIPTTARTYTIRVRTYLFYHYRVFRRPAIIIIIIIIILKWKTIEISTGRKKIIYIY